MWITESYVFVTSLTYDGNLGGISGGDAECNSLASSGTFVAWLSDSSTDAKDRIPSSIPFKTVDGTVIATDRANLIDGSIDNPINKDEGGNLVSSEKVWTGTSEFGIQKDSQHCIDWTSNSPTPDKGRKGDTGETDKKWTEDGEENCDQSRRLYCFQVS